MVEESNYLDKRGVNTLIAQIKQYVADHNTTLASVNVHTPSSELFGTKFVVNDKDGNIVYSTAFSSNGRAIVNLTEFGEYTFTFNY